MAFFFVVLLIDAQLVDPKQAKTIGLAEAISKWTSPCAEELPKVLPDLQRPAIDMNRPNRRRRAPCVR
jgi:hypothetical protein